MQFSEPELARLFSTAAGSSSVRVTWLRSSLALAACQIPDYSEIQEFCFYWDRQWWHVTTRRTSCVPSTHLLLLLLFVHYLYSFIHDLFVEVNPQCRFIILHCFLEILIMTLHDLIQLGSQSDPLDIVQVHNRSIPRYRQSFTFSKFSTHLYKKQLRNTILSSWGLMAVLRRPIVAHWWSWGLKQQSSNLYNSK